MTLDRCGSDCGVMTVTLLVVQAKPVERMEALRSGALSEIMIGRAGQPNGGEPLDGE